MADSSTNADLPPPTSSHHNETASVAVVDLEEDVQQPNGNDTNTTTTATTDKRSCASSTPKHSSNNNNNNNHSQQQRREDDEVETDEENMCGVEDDHLEEEEEEHDDDQNQAEDQDIDMQSHLDALQVVCTAATNSASSEGEDGCSSSFNFHMENKHTQRKTDTDMRTLSSYLKSLNESRNPERIPPDELDNYLSSFFMVVRKADGSEYEPKTGFFESEDLVSRTLFTACCPVYEQLSASLKNLPLDVETYSPSVSLSSFIQTHFFPTTPSSKTFHTSGSP
ncbi:uncharacterized protein DDB_G0292642-like [Octopus bimaculoides]|uniref:uncharacterized protein DDB_G0292642-like n=1 Tax=Octopus bimaculoides TaxID=37653 RepID=UPI00071E5A21|nr:uncharacterized protein DDB_G0292642-like [Octopus bimaculoides]|eukprot:XP_014780752.1 PREDICTED: uncharacterized protein DDB_G0292642-like [Octopus bimaculoides]